MGKDNDDSEDKTKRVVFVTVGTTCFDALVWALDSRKVKQESLAKGYTLLLIQMGRGCGYYLPTMVLLTLCSTIIFPSNFVFFIVPFTGLIWAMK